MSFMPKLPDLKIPTIPLGTLVKDYAVRNLGLQVGTGECADLADKALKAAGARSFADYGKTGPDADYIWGKLVNIKSVKAGDVLQFRNYLCTETTTVETRKTQSNGSYSTQTQTSWQSSSAAHHTAIVEAASTLYLDILEQNWRDKSGKLVKKVRRSRIFITGFATVAYETSTAKGVTTQVTTKRTVSVSGTIWPYTPVKK